MGWSGGTEVAERVVSAIDNVIDQGPLDQKDLVYIYKELIKALQDQGWDCEDELIGWNDNSDEALKALGLYPEYEEN